MVEMVILLPLVLILIFGLDFLRGLVMARMRAVEAARFVAFEGLSGVASRGDRSGELRAVGLGRGLTRVSGDASRSSIAAFVTGAPRGRARRDEAPSALAAFLGEDDGATESFRRALREVGRRFRDDVPAELLERAPEGHLGLAVVAAAEASARGSTASPALFALPDLLGAASGRESDGARSVITTRVTYGHRGRGLFRVFGRTRLEESASLVVDPFAELRCAGTACTVVDRVRGLWLVPDGIPVAPASDVGPTLLVAEETRADPRSLKRVVGRLETTLARLPLVGATPDFELPNVDLSAYPERELDDEGSAADGEDGFGAGLDTSGGGPFAGELGR